MSILNNTNKLQELMQKVNSLPTAENLDVALDAQDDLIRQIAEALQGKVLGDNNNGESTYPEGAFRVVQQFTAGKSYVLSFSYGGTQYYLTDTAFNDWTVQAATLAVQQQSGYVTMSGNPTKFTAETSGDGFTLTSTVGSITGMAESYGTELKVNTEAGTVFTVDTSETGGFSSGTYEPKADDRAVWLRAYLGDQNCCLKFESGNVSVGIDYAGRDATYSTGFISFVLYELC